jgi:hyperosmotically inducible protein
MKTKAFHLAVAVALGISGFLAAGCGDRAAVEAGRDAQGDPEIHVDGEQVEKNLKDTGEALRQGAEQVEEGAQKVGQSLENTAEKVGREVGPIAEEVLSDATITAKVKAKLIADPEINPFYIDVDTVDGVVTLNGKVGSANVSAEAEKLAKLTDGVKKVNNVIQVAGAEPAPTPATPPVPATRR